MPKKTIYVSLGEAEYVGGTITETTGKDISAAPVLVALGGYDPPPSLTDAVAPDVNESGGSTASRTVKMLIDNTITPVADVWLWVWLTDDPEVVPLRLDGPITVA